MKKFIFLSMLSVGLGGQFLSSVNYKDAKDMPAYVKRVARSKLPAQNKKLDAHRNGVYSHSSSSSSSSSSESEIEVLTFVSAVLNNNEGYPLVETGSPIVFNKIMDISGSISYNPATGIFTAFKPGSYEITYGVRFYGVGFETPIDPCAAIALRVNGNEVAGTEVSATFGNEVPEAPFLDADWATFSVIQNVTAATTFEVIASTNNIGLGIQLFNPSPCNTVNTVAYVTIKQI